MKGINEITFFVPFWIRPPSLHKGRYSLEDLKRIFSETDTSLVMRGNITIGSYNYIRDGFHTEALLLKQNKHERFPAILLIPGFRKSAFDFITRGITFARKGYVCLSITMPGFGRSEGNRDWVGPGTLKAIVEGYTKLRAEHFVDPNRIGVFGISRGALAASLLATGKIKVSAAVFASGLYDFRMAYDSEVDEEMKHNMQCETGVTEEAMLERSSVFTMNKLTCPVLILHGQDDKFNPIDQAYLLAQKLDELNKPYEKKFYENVGHDLGETDYMQRCIDFFNRALKGHDQFQ